MKTDGIFGVGDYEIIFNSYGKPITIYAISDIHWNSPACDLQKWEQFLNQAKSTPDTYFIFLGDLFDSLSSSERDSFVRSNFHDSTFKTISGKFENDIKDFVSQIKFMKNRVICFIGGNHFFEFKDGTTCDQRVAIMMGSQYLGCNALIRVGFRYKGLSHTQVLDFCLHHGLGGGRTVGASINKLEWMAKSFDADVCLMGHDHNRAIDYINRLGITKNRHGKVQLINKRIMLARTGSFLRSYEPGKSSYAVDAMYPASDLGALRITITPKRIDENDKDHRWLDVEGTI